MSEGALGVILAGLWPVVQPFVVSFLMQQAVKVSTLIAGWPTLWKRSVLAVLGVLVSYAGSLLSVQISGNPMDWGEATLTGLLSAVVAHLIYLIGKKKPVAP